MLPDPLIDVWYIRKIESYVPTTRFACEIKRMPFSVACKHTLMGTTTSQLHLEMWLWINNFGGFHLVGGNAAILLWLESCPTKGQIQAWLFGDPQERLVSKLGYTFRFNLILYCECCFMNELLYNIDNFWPTNVPSRLCCFNHWMLVRINSSFFEHLDNSYLRLVGSISEAHNTSITATRHLQVHPQVSLFFKKAATCRN